MFGREFPEGADKLKPGNLIRDESFLEICEPRIEFFYNLWLEKKERRGFLPRRADFSPEEMIELLPYIFMVDIDPSSGEFRYRLVGTNEVRLRRFDPTGRLVKDHCAATDPQIALDNYIYVFNSKSYLFDGTEMERPPYPPVKDHTLFVPTSSDGATVDIVIGLSVQFDE
ncbi:PAS domain-containing protein [Rhodovibrionaceae bacterium A322]